MARKPRYNTNGQMSQERFRYLCRIVISKYIDRNPPVFLIKELKQFIYPYFRHNASNLAGMLRENGFVIMIRRGKWLITDEAIERFNKGEFND